MVSKVPLRLHQSSPATAAVLSRKAFDTRVPISWIYRSRAARLVIVRRSVPLFNSIKASVNFIQFSDDRVDDSAGQQQGESVTPEVWLLEAPGNERAKTSKQEQASRDQSCTPNR